MTKIDLTYPILPRGMSATISSEFSDDLESALADVIKASNAVPRSVKMTAQERIRAFIRDEG